MNAKEAIENIKKLVFGDETPLAPLPVVFGTEYKLADGTLAMIDKLEVGGIIKVADVVIPDGSITLEDGTEIEIVSGLISAIELPEAPVVPNQMADQIAQMRKEFEAIKTDFEAHKIEFSKVSVKADTQEKANEELVKLVEFLASEPVKAPEKIQVDFEKMSALERFRATK